MNTTRTQRRLAKKRATGYPRQLTDTGIAPGRNGSGAWQQRSLVSRDYFVQEFHEAEGVIRLSVNRTTPTADSWADGISWDELMMIKRQCGYGDRVAVELYPDDGNVVNVSNMRHLWLLPETPPFMWRSSTT